MHQFFLGDLILLPSVFFAIERVHTNFLVILFQSSHIFTSFREFALLHAIIHIPMDKGPSCEEKVKLAIESLPYLPDGSVVGQNTERSGCNRDIGIRWAHWVSVVDSDLETGGTPRHKLNLG